MSRYLFGFKTRSQLPAKNVIFKLIITSASADVIIAIRVLTHYSSKAKVVNEADYAKLLR